MSINKIKKIVLTIVIAAGVSMWIYGAYSYKYKVLDKGSRVINNLFVKKEDVIKEYKNVLSEINKLYVNDSQEAKIQEIMKKVNEGLECGNANQSQVLLSDLKLAVENIGKLNKEELSESSGKITEIEKSYFKECDIRRIKEDLLKYNEFYDKQEFKNAKNLLDNMKEYLVLITQEANRNRVQDIYDRKSKENPTVREIKYINNILLVNKENPLPNTYNPMENKEARESFEKMKKDAYKEGIAITAFSVYRSYEEQGRLYNNYVSNYGRESTDTFSARAGFSEHQTGLAFDIGGVDKSVWGEDGFRNTTEFRWLKENSCNYGFILRYPEGKEWKSGYKYEPWHYRYIGIEHSKHFKDNNLTLEEYLGV